MIVWTGAGKILLLLVLTVWRLVIATDSGEWLGAGGSNGCCVIRLSGWV